MVDFEKFSDERFQQIFMHIISQSRKDNTYKFAFARFLLEYAENETEICVNFEKIARYFLKYYWLQICNSKLFQSAIDSQSLDERRKPKIVQILNSEFPEPHYSETFDQISQKEPEKIHNVIQKIKDECFKIVTFAFQRIKEGDSDSDVAPMFFDYKIKGRKPSRPDQVYVDLDFGIILNPHAIDFLKRFNGLLHNAVILQWAKFLEPLNIGHPQIIKTIESEFEPRNLQKERKPLEKIQDRYRDSTQIKSNTTSTNQTKERILKEESIERKDSYFQENESFEETIEKMEHLKSELLSVYKLKDSEDNYADYSYKEMFLLLEKHLKLLPNDKKYGNIMYFL